MSISAALLFNTVSGIIQPLPGNMWVGYLTSEYVKKVNKFGSVDATSGLVGLTWGIDFDGTNMWVVGNGFIRKIEPDMTITTYSSGNLISAKGIAFDGVNMWTSSSNNSFLCKVSPSGTATFLAGYGGTSQCLAYDGANMWVAQTDGLSLLKYDTSGTLLGAYSVGYRNTCIAYDGTSMWVGHNGVADNTISKVSSSGVVTNYTIPGTSDIRGIAFDGTNMWATGTTDIGVEGVFKIDQSGVYTKYQFSSGTPGGIAFDGVNMWTANSNSSISKISSSGVISTYTIGGTSPWTISFDGALLSHWWGGS